MAPASLDADALASLRALASGLCQKSGLTLSQVEGNEWHYNVKEHRIGVPRAALALGATYAAGVVAHEVGHAELTRLHCFGRAIGTDPLLETLALLMEERRVNAYIAWVYPGALAWIREVDAIDRSMSRRQAEEPVAQVARHLILSAWGDDAPEASVSPAVAATLMATAEARARHARLWSDLAGEAEAEPFETAVAPWLSGPVPEDPAERAVLRAQWAALRLARDEVLPALVALLGADRCQQLQRQLRQHPQRRLLLQDLSGLVPELVLRSLTALMPTRQSPQAGRAAASLPAASLPALAPPARVPRSRGSSAPELADLLHPPSARDGLERYRLAKAEMQDQIRTLVEAFASLFRARQRLREVNRQAGGARPDMRALMAWQADPGRADPRIWRRPSIPSRAEATVHLVVDCSGSMAGAAIEAAFRAMIVLVETLNELNLGVAVDGFQDRLIAFLSYGEPLTDVTRRRLGTLPLEVLGKRPGGNNRPAINDDGVALVAAARRLTAEPSHHRVLIMLCDGAPEAPGDAEARLRRAIAEVRAQGDIHLIGLGIGEGTAHVRDYYPDHDAEIEVSDFARRSVALLRRTLGVVAGAPGAGMLDRA